MPFQIAKRLAQKLRPSRHEDETLKMLAGAALVHLHRHQPPSRFQLAEFSVFSQFGDDGLIQYLLRELEPREHTFIEFGVESYQEANTRFLLQHDNWRGLVIDGSASNVEAIQRDRVYWRHELTAVESFITRENINDLILDAGFVGRVGILSIDIDGVDWWVWERLDAVDPLIVIAEYNSLFGPQATITVPYAPDFVRTNAHHSNLYWGCSLNALCLLAERKGYVFVGSNAAGNNAYFVRKPDVRSLIPLSSSEGYVESRFREARAPDGSLTFASGSERLAAIAELQAWDVARDCLVRVGDAVG